MSILLSFSLYGRFSVEREMAARRDEAQTELDRLREREQTLREKVDYLTAESGVEAELRKHFDVAKEGEQVVVLVGKDKEDGIVPIPPKEAEKQSFWQRLFSW